MSAASGRTAALATPPEPLRDQREVFRVDAREKQMIADLAQIHGLPAGTYARRAALGQLRPPSVGSQSPTSRTHAAMVDDVQADPAAENLAEAFPAKISTVNVGLTPAGEIVRERIVAEVEEAKLEDDPAHEAFIARRARELYGQGKTTILARAEAEAEWRNR